MRRRIIVPWNSVISESIINGTLPIWANVGFVRKMFILAIQKALSPSSQMRCSIYSFGPEPQYKG